MLLVALFGCLSGCSPAREPVRTTASVTPDITKGCAASSGLDTGPRVGVDPHPNGVGAVWLPGPNGSCKPVTTQGGPRRASLLAEDIRTAPVPPPGVFHCPADVGVGVELFFTYGAGRPMEQVDVRLSGCGGMDAPGRSSLAWGPHLLTHLLPITPPAWVRWVRR